MKYRIRETGKVYETLDEAVDKAVDLYCFGRDCGKCVIFPLAPNEKPSCHEAARRSPVLQAAIGVEELADAEPAKETSPAQMTRAEILSAAQKCVCGDRDQDYGSPESSFKAIASMWNSYLYAAGLMENSGPEWKGLKPKDVAVMMCLFKAARVATGHDTADNWIDLAGYAACGGEIEGGETDED